MKKDYFSLLDDYGEPFFAWVLFVSLLKFKSFNQFNPPELHQILDIYSVVMLYYRMLFITSSSESSQISNEIVKFWASKATKIFKILMSEKKIEFCRFQSFDKIVAKNRKDDLILIKTIQ